MRQRLSPRCGKMEIEQRTSDQHDRYGIEQGDRDQIGLGIRHLGAQQAVRDHAIRTGQESVAIRLVPCDRFGRDDAAGAWFVLDNRRLIENFCQPVGVNARRR